MFSVYILRSVTDGRIYVGQSADLQRRLLEHDQGMAKYTRGRGPWQCVHVEEYLTRSEAIQRERWLKTGVGRRWLKALLSDKLGSARVDQQ